MLKSSAGKLFFVFLLVFAAGCNFWRASDPVAPQPTPFVAAEIKSEIPFATKEPEIYQALAVSRIYAADGKTETKVLTARDGAQRLTVFDVGEKNETSLLELGANQTFLIRRDKKIYTENPEKPADGDPANIISGAGLLGLKASAAFEKLGDENGLSVFRVKLDHAENSTSEILIYVDENLKIPVRQEFYSLDSAQRTLMFSVEVTDFRLTADENLFVIPKDYRKVSSKQFQESFRETIKNE